MLKLRFKYLLITILFFDCSKNKEPISKNINKSGIENIFNVVDDNKVPYKRRVYFNNKLIDILSIGINDSMSREYLVKTSLNSHKINDSVALKKSAKILLKRSQEDRCLLHIAQSYRFYGLYFEKININDSAFYYCTKAQKLFTELNNKSQLCKILQDKALLYYKTNDYSSMELSLIEALKIAKREDIALELYNIYVNLGVCGMEQNEFKNAFNYFEKAMDIAQKSDDDFKHCPVSFCLNNIGVAYFHSGDVVTAECKYKLALKESNLRTDSPLIFCRLIDNSAYAKFHLNDFSNVPQLYFLSSAIRDSLNINEGRTDNRLYLAEYFTEICDTSQAKKYAAEAYSLSKKFKAPKDMLVCLKQLTKADPHNALKYSQEYIKISDSMHHLERKTRNKFAKIAFETEEIIQEKDSAVKQKSIFLTGMISIASIGSLLLIIKIQKSKQKNLVFEQSQKKANDEIYHLIQTQQSKIDEGRYIEKQRISRDLHDGVMNRLSSTRLNLHIIKDSSDADTIQKCLPYIETIHEIEKEIRDIAHDLNAQVFTVGDNYVRILNTLFAEQQKFTAAKLHIDIDKKIKWEKIKSVKKVNIYRILQEALRNAAKYADASNIFISISDQEYFILVEMHDDGIGFSVKSKKKGIGLQNIRSRAKDCGGLFHIDSKKNTGTTIIVSIPISNR